MKGGSGNNKLTFTNEKKGGVEKEVENSQDRKSVV